jgi:hypothetical protein
MDFFLYGTMIELSVFGKARNLLWLSDSRWVVSLVIEQIGFYNHDAQSEKNRGHIFSKMM